MTAILADLVLQLGAIALVFGGVLLALVLTALIEDAVHESKAWESTDRAIGRIGRDQIVGVTERITERDLRERR